MQKLRFCSIPTTLAGRLLIHLSASVHVQTTSSSKRCRMLVLRLWAIPYSPGGASPATSSTSVGVYSSSDRCTAEGAYSSFGRRASWGVRLGGSELVLSPTVWHLGPAHWGRGVVATSIIHLFRRPRHLRTLFGGCPSRASWQPILPQRRGCWPEPFGPSALLTATGERCSGR
jgi:hypothetical protein